MKKLKVRLISSNYNQTLYHGQSISKSELMLAYRFVDQSGTKHDALNAFDTHSSCLPQFSNRFRH